MTSLLSLVVVWAVSVVVVVDIHNEDPPPLAATMECAEDDVLSKELPKDREKGGRTNGDEKHCTGELLAVNAIKATAKRGRNRLDLVEYDERDLMAEIIFKNNNNERKRQREENIIRDEVVQLLLGASFKIPRAHPFRISSRFCLGHCARLHFLAFATHNSVIVVQPTTSTAEKCKGAYIFLATDTSQSPADQNATMTSNTVPYSRLAKVRVLLNNLQSQSYPLVIRLAF